MVLFYHFITCYLLNLSNALNLNHGSLTGRNSLKARARRHRLRQEINVDLVHGSEVLHVGKVDIVLDDLLERGAGQLENLLQVLEDGSLSKAMIELADLLEDQASSRHTVACLISPVAV
jgi:hypothetical protein